MKRALKLHLQRMTARSRKADYDPSISLRQARMSGLG